jgi:WD40 repeat protein
MLSYGIKLILFKYRIINPIDRRRKSMKLYKTIILTVICAFFSPSISAVEFLQKLGAKQLAHELVSADMLNQFKNNPHFIEEMALNNPVQDMIKDVILSSYRPAANNLCLKDWIAKNNTHFSIKTDFIKSVISFAFSPDRSRIAISSWDGSLKIFDTHGNLDICYYIAPVSSIVWSLDGSRIATTAHTRSDNKAAYIWNARNGDPLHTLPPIKSESIIWSPDGNRIAAISADDDTAKIWDVQNDTLLHTLDHNAVCSVAWSPDGNYLATASDDNTAKIWNLENDLPHYTGTHSNVTSRAWSPDGSCIAIGYVDGTTKILDPQNNNILKKLVAPNNSELGVRAIAWSPDGNHIATLNGNHIAIIWNPHKLLYRLLDTTTKITRHVATSAAWSPDGNYIATGSNNGATKIYDPENGVRLYSDHESGPISSVAWSPDGNCIATLSYQGLKFLNLPQLPSLSLEQTLFLAFVYHNYINNQPLTLDAAHGHLHNIYYSLPGDIQNSVRKRIVIKETRPGYGTCT